MLLQKIDTSFYPMNQAPPVHPGTLSFSAFRALSEKEKNRIPPDWAHWPLADQRALHGGTNFPYFLATYHIGHPRGEDKLLPEYITLLDNYERNILFAVAIHMGRPKIAYQLLTEAIADAIGHDSITDIGCMAGYVPEDIFQNMDIIYNIFNAPYNCCQCTKSLRIVAKSPLLV